MQDTASLCFMSVLIDDLLERQMSPAHDADKLPRANDELAWGLRRDRQ